MPTKRSNGKWIARVAHKGEVHYCGTNHETRRGAAKAEQEKRDELERYGNRRAETVDEFAARWLVDYPRAAAATRLTYKYAAAAIGKAFEGVPVREVDPTEARQWANAAPDSTRQVARAMFNDALADRLVERNPFANLRIAQSRGRRDIEVISEAEVYELAEIARAEHGDYGAEFAAWIVYQAFTLKRPGETSAVEWSDFDYSEAEIAVTKNFDSTGQIKWPKNGKPRTIILPPPARETLRQVPRVLATVELFDVRKGTDGEFRNFDLVFRGKRGGPLREPKILAYWGPVRAAFKAKHPERSLKDPYELRHFGATYLLENGCTPDDVALQMGHEDGGRLVQERYGHPSRKLARARLKRAFGENVTDLRPVKELRG